VCDACSSPIAASSQVGAFNAVLMTYLGLLAGRVLIYHKAPLARVKRLAVLGAAAMLVGACLCGFSQNDGLIPVNKNLWSTSFVLVGHGACAVRWGAPTKDRQSGALVAPYVLPLHFSRVFSAASRSVAVAAAGSSQRCTLSSMSASGGMARPSGRFPRDLARTFETPVAGCGV